MIKTAASALLEMDRRRDREPSPESIVHTHRVASPPNKAQRTTAYSSPMPAATMAQMMQQQVPHGSPMSPFGTPTSPGHFAGATPEVWQALFQQPIMAAQMGMAHQFPQHQQQHPCVVFLDSKTRLPVNPGSLVTYPYARGPYRCRRCGQMKRMHRCTFDGTQRSVSTQTFPLALTPAAKTITVGKRRQETEDDVERDERKQRLDTILRV